MFHEKDTSCGLIDYANFDWLHLLLLAFIRTIAPSSYAVYAQLVSPDVIHGQ